MLPKDIGHGHNFFDYVFFLFGTLLALVDS